MNPCAPSRVNTERAIPLLLGRFAGGMELSEPGGVVAEHIDPAADARRRGDHGLDIRGHGNIRRHEPCIAQRRGHRAPGFGIDVGDHHLRPGFIKHLDDRAANTVRSTRYDRNFALECDHAWLASSFPARSTGARVIVVRPKLAT